MVKGIGDGADMGRAGDLRRHPQAQQQDRLHQHAEHRFATAAQRGKRAAGIQTGNGKEETGDGEQVDQGDEIPQHRQRGVYRHHRQRGGDGQHHAHHDVRRQAKHPARGVRTDALAAQQFQDIAILLQYPRSTAVMQPRAGDANDPGQQRRDGKQHQRL